MWIIKLKDENKFIKLDRSYGKQMLTTNRHDCKTFKTESDASAFIRNSIAKKQRDNYIPVRYVPSSTKNTIQDMEKILNKNVDDINFKCNDDIHTTAVPDISYIEKEAEELLSNDTISVTSDESENIQSAIESLEFDYANFFNCLTVILDNAPKHHKECVDRFHKCELALTDISHYIEFNDLNIVGGYKIYKYQQELLKLRRKLKDEIKIMEIILNDMVNRNAKAYNVVNFLNVKESRAYCPRVLNNLFRAGINKLTEDCKESI